MCFNGFYLLYVFTYEAEQVLLKIKRRLMIGRFFLDLYNPNCNNMNFDYSRDVCENGAQSHCYFRIKPMELIN
ncbi:hypothetical protein TU53_27600 [Bacillus cereus]|jgi:hypothetical protein|nr:hypothetical protein TU53_27600 [Bacillus cereus]KXY79763.1 hypothetical protein AT272_21995 [Bacillus cereus]OBZ59998.1 hypothetical protein UN66_05840 [Bacillus cereus]OJE16494.1 hypothetical protein BAQ45_22875 [Bacillus pacificus]